MAAPTLSCDLAILGNVAAPIRVGVIGQGSWGRRLTSTLRALSAYRVEAVCDVRADRLPVNGAPCLTQRVEDVLSSGLDAVFIATSPTSHADLAVTALESGHHVFVEKPCALSSRDAERICWAAERADRVAGVGHLLRHHASYGRLVELVHTGALGTTVGVVAERVGSRPRTDVDAWWMLAPHDLSVLFAMFGESATDLRRTRTGHDEFVAFGHFAGTPALLEVRSGGAASRRFAVVGSRLTALFDDLSAPNAIRLVPTRGAHLRKLVTLVESPEIRRNPAALSTALSDASLEPADVLHVAPSAPPLERELAAFAAAIRDGLPLSTDAREGLAVVSMLESAAREKRSVVPPVAVHREPAAPLEP